MPPRISVIIPTWNEGRRGEGTLRRLRSTAEDTETEIVVVDGGSKDETVTRARKWADQVIPLGGVSRGAQLHRGAKAAKGDLFFFLDPSTQPAGDWHAELIKFWTSEKADGAAATVFSLRYGGGLGLACLALARNLRADFLGAAHGEAGFCVPREIYEASGGFPEIRVLEEVVFSERIGKKGKIVRLPGKIRPAARRLRAKGALRGWLRYTAMTFRMRRGEDPESIWRRYFENDPIPRIMPGLNDGEEILKRAVRESRY